MEEPDSRVFVSIADHGEGIARDKEELQTGCSGIDITGIKQSVEELGGQLVFRNTDPGTVVEVTIPVKVVRDPSVAHP